MECVRVEGVWVEGVRVDNERWDVRIGDSGECACEVCRVEGEVGRRRGEIPVRSEIGVGQLQPLAEHALKLWYACSNDGTTVNHGTLLANKKPWKQVTIETGYHRNRYYNRNKLP